MYYSEIVEYINSFFILTGCVITLLFILFVAFAHND